MSTLNVIDRLPNQVHLALTKDPDVVRFRFSVARTLNDAYVGQNGSPFNGVVGAVGTSEFLTVEQGSDFISTGLRRKKLGFVEESNRGLTIVKYDPDEYTGATNPGMPPDHHMQYLRVNEYRRGPDDFVGEGPIYLVPPRGFYSMPHPVMTLAGNVPNIAAAAAGSPAPAGSMVIVLPKFMGAFTLTNLDGTNEFLFAFGEGMPLTEIPPGGQINLTNADENLLILVNAGANPGFSLVAQVQNSAI